MSSDFSAYEADLASSEAAVVSAAQMPTNQARIGVAALVAGGISMAYGDSSRDIATKAIYSGLATILGLGIAQGTSKDELAAPLGALGYYLMASRSGALDYASNMPLIAEAVGAQVAGELGARRYAAPPSRSYPIKKPL